MSHNSVQRRHRVRRQPIDWDVWDAIAFIASVALILIYAHVWFAPLTSYGEEKGDALRSVFYLAYLLAAALILPQSLIVLRGFVFSPFLLVLIGLAIVSVHWSIAPDITTRRLVALVFTILGGAALAARWRWSRFVEVLATAFAAMAILSLLLGILKPDWGRMTEVFPGAWRGLWIEKNSLGGMMALGALIHLAAAAVVPDRRVVWLGSAVMSIVLVLLSQSKTSLLVLLMGLTSMIFVAIVRSGPLRAIAGTWGAVVAGAMVALLSALQWKMALEWLGKDATLTGRTKIWSGILDQMRTRGSTGYGYGAIWDNPSPIGPAKHIAKQADFLPAHAHSGWLELYIGLGWPAVVAFGLWLVAMWIAALWAVYTHRSGWLLLPFVMDYTLTMLTESITLNWHDPWWVLFVAVSMRTVIGDPRRLPAGLSRDGRPRLRRLAALRAGPPGLHQSGRAARRPADTF